MKRELGHCLGRQALNSNLQLPLRRHARRKDDNFIALSYVVATNLLVLAYLALWHIWLRRDARDKRITAAGRKNSWNDDGLEFVLLFSFRYLCHKFTCFGIFSFVTYLAASRRSRQENHSGGTKKLVKWRRSRICNIIFISLYLSHYSVI